MIIVRGDFETYSEVDLTVIGAYAYAQHPSTDALCFSYKVYVKGKLKYRGRWLPGDEYPFTGFDEVHAWNSQFERLIWQHVMVKRYGWPKQPLEAFVCTSAQARITAAGPAKLEVAGAFFARKMQKDMAGHKHMLYMCKPAPEKEQLDWLRGAVDRLGRTVDHEEAKRCHHTPANIEKLGRYCDRDVDVEDDIARILPEWRDEDLQAFWESERINDRGLGVDVDFAIAATEYAEEEKVYFAQRVIEITGNEVQTPRQFDRIKKWCDARMSDEAWAITEWYDNGVLKNSFDADTRANLLSEYASDPDFLTEEVAEFIEVLDAAGKSTISKYQAIANRAIAHDGRHFVNGLYVYSGASQSGRYSSTGIQAHNLVRDVPKNTLRLISAFKRRDERDVKQAVAEWADAKNEKLAPQEIDGKQHAEMMRVRDGRDEGHAARGAGNRIKKMGGPSFRKVPAEPIHALGQLVRPTIIGCPKGTADLVWCDWSSVEARMLPWLTIDPRAEERLGLFRRGEDIYLITASAILRRKITKADEFERQAYGKVPELSLGYLGGAGAFKAMAKNYGVRLSEEEINKIVRDWREANPWAMDFGDALETAAMNAMRSSNGASFSAGRISYRYDPDALDGWGCLFAKLPSGREIPYPGARIDLVRTKWGKEQIGITAAKSAWRPKKGVTEWPRVSVWKGLLAENGTQAACADLLNLALLRAPLRGLEVVAHTHDEIIIESDAPEVDMDVLREVMERRPGWPGDDALPLKAEAACGYRYKVKFED